ncbi:hypothetical protein AB0H17_03020 [Streptomyces olivoreticuli]
MKIGIAGHRGLSDDVERLVRQQLVEAVSARTPEDLVGVSCIADGPDAWFAQAVLDHGGRIEVVVPAEGYRNGQPSRGYGGTADVVAHAIRTGVPVRVLWPDNASRD